MQAGLKTHGTVFCLGTCAFEAMLAEDVGSSLAKFKKSDEPAKMLEVWKDLTVNQAFMIHQLVCFCFMAVSS